MNNSNSTLKTLDDFNTDMRSRLTAPLVYLGLLSLIGLPGNVCILLIFRNYRRGVYRTLIMTIGCVDLVFCLIGIPFNMTRILFYYKFTIEWICQLFVGVLDFGIILSTHLLLLLSFHRFRQVCFPMKWQIKQSTVKYFIISCIIISLGLSIPQVAVLQPLEEAKLSSNVTGYICAVSWKNAPFYWTVYNFFLTGLFLTYAFIMSLIYTLIGRKIILAHIKRKESAVNFHSDAASNKMTKIAFAVCVAFAISYLPLYTNELLTKKLDQSTLSDVEFAIFKIYERSYLINHVVNSFIYTVLDDHFRRRLKNLFLSLLCVEKFDNTIETRTNSKATLEPRSSAYTISSHL